MTDSQLVGRATLVRIKPNIKKRDDLKLVNFENVFSLFLKFKTNDEEFVNKLISIPQNKDINDFVVDEMNKFIEEKCHDEIELYKKLKNFAHISDPLKNFPKARYLKRKIIYHSGFTNSGKTYEALQRLKKAQTGVYLSPLRLLAVEVYNSLNKDGVKCDLLTGQEIKRIPFATHFSSTIEMANMHSIFEVAVIDEIQMLNDPERGGAWTNALLGVNAFEVHLCGDQSAIPIVTEVCKRLGEELVIKNYERFNKLHIDKPLESSIQNLQPRDCIVAFRRQDIFLLKQHIEIETKFKCCVVYGSLPFDIRTEQADIFNDLNSGYNILIASDAIGLGLNLNIRRIIFYSVHKSKGNGEALERLPISLIKQIGGRAGRRQYYDAGHVTTFHNVDHPIIESTIHESIDDTKKIACTPSFDEFKKFYGETSKLLFSNVLMTYFKAISIHDLFFVTSISKTMEFATLIDDLHLPLLFKWEILFAGFPHTSKIEFRDICVQFSEGKQVKLNYKVKERKLLDHQMAALEDAIKLIDAFLYIGNRYPERFELQNIKEESVILKKKLTEHFFQITDNNKRMNQRRTINLQKDRTSVEQITKNVLE